MTPHDSGNCGPDCVDCQLHNFHYEAMNAEGQEISDNILAMNIAHAQSKVRAMGYFVTNIHPKIAQQVKKTFRDRVWKISLFNYKFTLKIERE